MGYFKKEDVSMAPKTACAILIGNELLSGQTQEANLLFLAQCLQEIGVIFREARIIPDQEDTIIEAVNNCRKKYDYVFTTGGIGPTHDDITALAIARAFHRPFKRHPIVEQMILSRYPPSLPYTEARLRMADMPEGVTLIPNTVSTAPGFQIENVFVLAGVPNIMQAMIRELLPKLERGSQCFIRSIFCPLFESHIAEELRDIQAYFPSVEIGSYPSWRHDEEQGVKLILKGFVEESVIEAYQKIVQVIKNHGVEPISLSN